MTVCFRPLRKLLTLYSFFFTGDANGAGNLLCVFGFASFLLTSVQVTWSIHHMHLTLENLWYFIQKPLGPELIYHYLDYPDHSP